MRRRRGSNLDAVRDSNEGTDLNFAQRLLMANENAVTNIADLWVASAINVDNEDVFESDDEDGLEGGNELLEGEGVGAGSSTLSPPYLGHRPSTTSFGARRPSHRHPSVSFPAHLQSPRRPSIVPSIFSHSGVRTPPAILEAQKLLSGEGDEHLGTIAESGQASQADAESLREPPSLSSQIPTLIIVQYGVMALHTTTHDQIFMSYLVS